MSPMRPRLGLTLTLAGAAACLAVACKSDQAAAPPATDGAAATVDAPAGGSGAGAGTYGGGGAIGGAGGAGGVIGAGGSSGLGGAICTIDAHPFEPGPQDCVPDEPVLAGGQPTGFSRCGSAGPLHRSSKLACPDMRVAAMPGTCTQPGAAYCRSNDDCAAQPHGLCVSTGSGGYCKCSSICVTDVDCPTGKICQCGGGGGVCVAAQCTSDADCGPGLLCAAATTIGGLSTFACQTKQDICLTNAECPPCANVCAVDTHGARVCAIISHQGGPMGNP